MSYVALQFTVDELHIETDATRSGFQLKNLHDAKRVILNGETFPVSGETLLRFINGKLQRDAAQQLSETFA